MIEECVSGDAHQPGFEARLKFELAERPMHLEERFLCQLIGNVCTARQTAEVKPQPRLVALDELRKC